MPNVPSNRKLAQAKLSGRAKVNDEIITFTLLLLTASVTDNNAELHLSSVVTLYKNAKRLNASLNVSFGDRDV